MLNLIVMKSDMCCDHCHEKIIISEPLDLNGELYHFCCSGCRSVFEILQLHNLSTYYKIRQESGESNFQTINLSNQKFLYLDEETFQEKYAHKKNENLVFTFYLEGVHCLACLWLIEKMPEIDKGIISAQLNMAKSTVEVTISREIQLSSVAKRLEMLGYPPHPLIEESNLKTLQDRDEKKDLIRIAISFFCAGNIMLMAFATYAGADGVIKKYFDYLSFLLFLPILLYLSLIHI